MSASEFDRRDFLKRAGSVGAGIALAGQAFAKSAAKTSTTRVLGANDRINVGVIGVGGRGSYVASAFTKYGDANNNACQIVAVCDVYEKRKALQAKKYNCQGYLDYREVLARPDIDAVVVATPDHWLPRSRWKPWTKARTFISKNQCVTPPKK